MADIIENGIVNEDAWEAAVKKAPKTKAGEYRATERGYAGGDLVEAGEAVPADTPISKRWMEKVSGKEDQLAEQIADVQNPFKQDPALDTLDTAALQKMAVEGGATNVKGLSKKDLITLITTERDRTRTQ